jgi:hypothetical protein
VPGPAEGRIVRDGPPWYEVLWAMMISSTIRGTRHRIMTMGWLVVIDPLMSVMGESIDKHRTREVRFVPDPLARMADRIGSVILGIAHVNKATGTECEPYSVAVRRALAAGHSSRGLRWTSGRTRSRGAGSQGRGRMVQIAPRGRTRPFV